MNRVLRPVVDAGRKLGNEPAGRAADADDIDTDVAFARELERGVDLPAPGLTVREDDERLGAEPRAIQLFVEVEHLDTPVDAFLDVGVPAGVVFETKRWLLAEIIEEEEERIGVPREPDLGRRPVREKREGDPLVLPAQQLREHPDPRHRPLPPVRRHVADPHRGRPVLQDDEVGARVLGDRRLYLRTRQRQDQRGHRQHQAEPERQPAREGVLLTHRRGPLVQRAAGITAPADQLPDPQQTEAGRDQQQPEVERFPKLDRRHEASPGRLLKNAAKPSSFSCLLSPTSWEFA